MAIRPGVTIVVDRTKAVGASIQRLVGSRVLVGFPEGEGTRDDDSGLNNPTLGYIHNFGAPEANIPAREFMESGIGAVQKTVTDWLGAAAKLALKGKDATVGAALTGAGLAAVSGIKGRIASGIPPPLQPSTVARRRKRSKGSGYRRKAATPEQATPLIDTGELQGAVTFVIDRPGN